MAAKKALFVSLQYYYLEALDQDETLFRSQQGTPRSANSVSFVRLDSANGTISGYNHIVSSLVFRTLPINNDKVKLLMVIILDRYSSSI